MTVSTLKIGFTSLLSQNEIPAFRGALLKSASQDSDVLLHNHYQEGFRYRYPLIQYKSIDAKAAIFSIGEGVGQIAKLMKACNSVINIGKRKTSLTIETLLPQEFEIKIGGSLSYHISDWLPLNEENEEKFLRLGKDEDRFSMLEQILIGNILSFAKTIDLFLDEEIDCKISKIDHYHFVECKGVLMRSFDADFTCNISLPDYMGLGKHASFGFGTINKN